MVLRCHDDPPEMETREALRLIDAQPVLDDELLALGQWIAGYYCAPLGEVLRGMLPLASEIRKGKIYSLTDAGRDATRQLLLDAGGGRSRGAGIARARIAAALGGVSGEEAAACRQGDTSLEKRGFIYPEQVQEERDPLRAPSDRLRVELLAASPEAKLSKAERELVAFLELHPGSHNLKDLESRCKSASAAARSLARKKRVSLEREPMAITGLSAARAPHRAESAPTGGLHADSRRPSISRQFHAFLLHGVTGSGKTEVYLNAIDTALAAGRGALLLVPEIALTPAMAGQFFGRFGDRVAILHSAFTDTERAEQWRKIRSGAAGVVVGTRSGVFAPVRNLGSDRGGRRARPELQAGGESALQRPRRGDRAGEGGWRVRGAGQRHAESREPLQRASAASTRCSSCRTASRRGRCRRWS